MCPSLCQFQNSKRSRRALFGGGDSGFGSPAVAMEASTLVIKVKYGDFLRRFNASVMDEKLDLSVDKLIEKIRILFNFATDTELTLTYIDEDGETVTLVDDADLLDTVEQGLNPLRITVTANEEKNSSPFICSTGSSTPRSSPEVQQQFQNINPSVSEIPKTAPDPLREALAKLSTDLVSKVSSSAPGITPVIAEIVEYFSKVGLSYLSHISEPQATVRPTSQNDIPESKATVTETKDSDSSKVDPTPSKAQLQGRSEKQLSRNNEDSPNLESVATMKIHEVKVEPSRASFNSPFVANNVSTEEKVNKASGPHLGPNPAFSGAHDCVKGDPLDGRTKHGFPCDFGNSPHSLTVPNPGSVSKLPDSFFSPFHAYECQLSGIPVENISTALPQPASQAISFGRNVSQNDVNGMMVKDNSYNRIDLPEIHPHQWPSRGLHDFHAQGYCSLESQVHRGMEVNPGVSKLDSCFIVDVTMIDGALITPLTPFTKIWRMRNNGTVVWPEKTQLVWIGGDKLSNTFSVELRVPAIGLAVNKELDVAVDFISPKVPGRYVSYWIMASPSGQKFGQRVWVRIQVHATIEETQHGVPGFNLNLPLVNNVLTGPEINNAVIDPLVEDSRPVEVFEPITPLPNIEHDTKFPISDSSMVGSGATNLAPTAPSTIFYPVLDQSDMATPVYPPPYVHYLPPPPPVIFPKTSPLLYTLPAPPVIYPLPPSPRSLLYPLPPHPFYPPPPPLPTPVTFPPHPASLYTSTSPPLLNSWPPPAAGNTQGLEELEKKLLRELEEMGFKRVDLNKEILRFHEYDLQKTLEDLCEGTGWNSIREEHHEMK